MDSISCKECKKCLFINTLQLIIQSSTKYKLWQRRKAQGANIVVIMCMMKIMNIMYEIGRASCRERM